MYRCIGPILVGHTLAYIKLKNEQIDCPPLHPTPLTIYGHAPCTVAYVDWYNYDVMVVMSSM